MTPPNDRLESAVADILIVEDEEAHAEAMQEVLSRLGHRCTVAADGASAVARLSGQHFDIVVTDLMLGEGPDGLAVLEAVRGVDAGAIARGVADKARIPEAIHEARVAAVKALG